MHSHKYQFFHHVLPSMAAFAFSGLYTIVDGFFVGQNIGDYGLAAINIAYPITAFIQASGTGIGMAGAIWIAISTGENNEKKKNEYLGNTISLLLLLSLFFTILLSFTYQPLLQLLGAEGTILEYASSYLKIIVLGTFFQLSSVGLLPLIRNYNGSLVAMIAMIAGFVTNIFLDYYFTSVLKQGTAGAALATVIGQAVSLVPCLVFAARRRSLFAHAQLKFRPSCVKKIWITMIAPFGAVLSPMFVLIILNKAALVYGGESAVACYAVISYVTAVVYLLLQGVGDGVQPLIGTSYGASDRDALHVYKKMAFTLALCTATCCLILLFVSGRIVPYFFGASETVSAMYPRVLLFFLIGLPFIAVTKISGSYFYATGRNKIAYALIYSESVITLVLSGFLFPKLWGMTGVWAAVPLAQCFLAVVSMIVMKSTTQNSNAVKCLDSETNCS